MKPKHVLIIFLLLPALAKAISTDYRIKAITPMEYQVPGTKAFSVTLEQLFNATFTTAEIYWLLDNGTVNHVTKLFSDLYWQHYSMSVKTAWVTDAAFQVTLSSVGKHKLKAWVKTIYPLDSNHANDTLVQEINVFSALPKKNVIAEMYTRQDFVPAYKYRRYDDTVVRTDPDYIIVNCYNNPLESLYYPDTEVYAINFSSGFDRFKFPFLITMWIQYQTDTGGNITGLVPMGQREQFYEPVQVFFKNMSYNTTTRELKARVAAGFFDTLSGDYRLNILLTENGVVDSQKGAPVPGSCVHNNVLRARLGGYWGKAGSLPTVMAKGTTWDYEFTYTIPAGYNFDSLNIIALIQKYTTDPEDRRILNASQKNLKAALAINNTIAADNNICIYPNPSKGTFTLQLNNDDNKNRQVAVYDMTGRAIYQSQITGSKMQITLDQPNGIYLVKVQSGDMVFTQHITIE